MNQINNQTIDSNQELIKVMIVSAPQKSPPLTAEVLKSCPQETISIESSTRVPTDLDHDLYIIDESIDRPHIEGFMNKLKHDKNTTPVFFIAENYESALNERILNMGFSGYILRSELTKDLYDRRLKYALQQSSYTKSVHVEYEMFRQLFERSIDAMFVVDLSYRLVSTNKAFEELFNADLAEGSNVYFSDFFAREEDFQVFSDQLDNKSQARNFEAALQPAEDQVIVCQITAIARTTALNEIVGYQGIIRDINILRQAEMKLLMAEKLTMTGKIARSIAHEVRNPLTNLGLALDQLEDELPEDNEDAHMFTHIISRNAKRIGHLITEMLNSSKPEELHKEPYDVNKLLDESISLIIDKILMKNIQVETQFDEQVGVAMVDVEKLKIAVVNILMNAIEAVQENEGKIKIISLARQDEVEMTIMDNGVGIDQDHISSLSDPFYSNKQRGMGLGLTSTQNIINSHGGIIHVSSEMGKGTSLTLTVPTR